MSKINIMRTVVVKQLVTEDYKKKAASQIQESLKKIESDLEVFDKQAQKSITELTLKGHPQINQIKQQIDMERQKLTAYKQKLVEDLKIISKLTIGEEVVQGTIDSPVEIQIGDNFDALNRTEIVIKDGVIVEIRGK